MIGVAKLERGEGHVGLLEVPDPEAIPGHVVIEVKAAGVCGTDLHIYHDEYPTDPPVILGHELAGIVAAVGEGVTLCQPGDRVTSETYYTYCERCAHCREGYPNQCLQRKSIGSGVHGAFARYVRVPERNIHPLPDHVDMLAGALTEPLACCVHALMGTRVEPGDAVVISGPGAVGLLMTQVAKAAGARVTVLGTAVDEERLALAQALGADHTVNVETGDAAARVGEWTDGAGADVVFECAGVGASARTCLNVVRRRGRYAQVGLFGGPIEWNLVDVALKELHVSGTFATIPAAWPKALQLLASGQVQTRPLVSDRLSLTEWQQAFEAFERRQGVKPVLIP